jgi:hypothetical protein
MIKIKNMTKTTIFYQFHLNHFSKKIKPEVKQEPPDSKLTEHLQGLPDTHAI